MFRFPSDVRQLISYQYSAYKEDFRESTCDLLPFQSENEFGDCGVSRNQNQPTLFLWGDSHAAHLYQGLKDRFEPDFNIIQRTASNCPPLLGVSYPYIPHCHAMNESTFKLIQKEKPDRVILSADWVLYDWSLLVNTISALKKIGIRKIDLVGPSPHWNNRITKQIFLNMRARSLNGGEEFMSIGLNNHFLQLDAKMNHFAHEQGVNYISMAKILCAEQGCRFRVGPTLDQLIYFDESHLTKFGSQYTVSQFPALR